MSPDPRSSLSPARTMPALARPSNGIVDALRARDFSPTPVPGEFQRCDGLRLQCTPAWHTLIEDTSTPDANPAAAPGLWKTVRTRSGWERRFEIPAWAGGHTPSSDLESTNADAPASWITLLDWALATRRGTLPPGWSPPAADWVAALLPPGALTFPARGHVRQGILVLNPARWALSAPIVPEIPDRLPHPRREALQELLLDATSRWAMVRVHPDHGQDRAPQSSPVAGSALAPAATAIVATVDFTGAPHDELLLSAGRDVLSHVVAWLVETVEVLADPDVAITAGLPGLDGNPNTNPNQRRQP